MKRTSLRLLLSLFLCLSLILSYVPAKADTVTEIYTVEDLKSIKNDPYGDYRLMTDLDLAGEDWVPFAFYGDLDGDGHTIINLTSTKVGSETADTVDGNDKVYDTYCGGLFSQLISAEVHQLTLLGVDINVENDNNVFIGSLAGVMDGAYIHDVTVSDARLNLTTAGTMVGIGGLVGFGFGTIDECQLESTMIFVDTDPNARCEQFMGGLLSCGNAWIDSCDVTIDGYISCSGYVHSGGLMGMFYQYSEADDIGAIYSSTVKGAIHFFENNEDRRAYCQAYVGEPLTYVEPDGCSFEFEGEEVWDYYTILSPETCEEPVYTERVITVSCLDEGIGYTRHTCDECGYSYRDSFTLPTHGETVWEDMSQPQEGIDGLRTLTCKVCGTVLETEVIPALPIHEHTPSEIIVTLEANYFEEGAWEIRCTECDALIDEGTTPPLTKATQILLSQNELNLNYKDTATLTAQLLPSDALDTSYHWSSSNEEIATVDENGNVTAVGRGTTYITCLSDDTFALSQCTVTVDYTFGQWLIMTICFGWLWY